LGSTKGQPNQTQNLDGKSKYLGERVPAAKEKSGHITSGSSLNAAKSGESNIKRPLKITGKSLL